MSNIARQVEINTFKTKIDEQEKKITGLEISFQNPTKECKLDINDDGQEDVIAYRREFNENVLSIQTSEKNKKFPTLFQYIVKDNGSLEATQ